MQTRKNDSIIPFFHEPDEADFIEGGLTKREYFAVMALQGLLSNPELMHFKVCEVAVKKADELIETLNQISSNNEK